MSNPFDFVKAIQSTKKNLMRGSYNDELREKDYVPYIANMALTLQGAPYVFFANEMNMNHRMPKRAQFEYLLNTVRKGSGSHKKWPDNAETRNADNEMAMMICRQYKVNLRVARTYLDLLSDEQISMIQEKQEKGGIENGRTRRNIR